MEMEMEMRIPSLFTATRYRCGAGLRERASITPGAVGRSEPRIGNDK